MREYDVRANYQLPAASILVLRGKLAGDLEASVSSCHCPARPLRFKQHLNRLGLLGAMFLSQAFRSRRQAAGMSWKNSPARPSPSVQMKSPVACTTWVVPGNRETARSGTSGSAA